MQATDFHPQKVFPCPCLLNIIDNIFDFGFQSLSDILTYLHNLENFPNEKIKIYHTWVNKKKDLMTICEWHLKVAILPSISYSCTSNQDTDFVVDLQEDKKWFCKGCVRHYWEKMVAFLNLCKFNSK